MNPYTFKILMSKTHPSTSKTDSHNLFIAELAQRLYGANQDEYNQLLGFAPEAVIEEAVEIVDYSVFQFGIGAIGSEPAGEPNYTKPRGQICRKCGCSEDHGAMFTTIKGSGICDDCI